MTEYVIGIDVGTGSTKAVAVNSLGEVILSSQSFYPSTYPQPGFCEQNPSILWDAFTKCICEITSNIKSNPSAISISTAMHSIMAVDSNGIPLHNLIIWADNRSGDIAKKIRNSAAGEMLYEQTGTPIHSMSPLCKISWLKENSPSLFKSAYKFISIKEFIWYKLFNKFEVDHSIASAEGLMDIQNCQWSKNALDVCGISEDKLSALVSPDFIRTNASPEICEDLKISAITPFIIGSSDGCMANLGSFATDPGIAAITIGTSGAIRVASKSPVYNFGAMTFNYVLDSETFMCGGPSNNGGLALKWYIENFLQRSLSTQSDYDNILNNLSETSAGADGLLFLPYLFGERAPIWDSEARGIFYGIKGSHNQFHFTRAVIEGITMALYDIANHMIQSGLKISQINVSGGFIKSSSWLQILANIFNKKVCLINSDDASAMGASYLALKCLRLIKNYNDIKPEVIKEIFPQQECVQLYQEKLLIYRNLYKVTSFQND